MKISQILNNMTYTNPYGPRDDEDATDYDAYLIAHSKVIDEYLGAVWEDNPELAVSNMTEEELVTNFYRFCMDNCIQGHIK